MVRSHLGEPVRLTGPVHIHMNSLLKPLRSCVKGKHSKDREFQSLAVRGKKLLT